MCAKTSQSATVAREMKFMQIALLTDLHLVAQGSRLYGVDPAERLIAAIRTINRRHPSAALIVIMGDLTHRGDEAAYRCLSEIVAESSVPVHLMLGNHDRRDAFRRVFPNASLDDSDFVQSAQIFDDATIITLDTLDETAATDCGLLCADRMAFLARTLSVAPGDRPLLLFQHHPPFDTGLGHMDDVKLRNGSDELAVFARTRRPDYLFTGHLHRPVAGIWRGTPFHIQRGIGHQVAFEFETAGELKGCLEPPDYALVTVSGYDIVIHESPFLYDGPTFLLGSASAANAGSPGELTP